MNGLPVHSLIDHPGPTADDHESAAVELRRFKCFVTLAEALHFGPADSMLLMARPVLTHRIQVLEKELGVRLFIHSTRRFEIVSGRQNFLSAPSTRRGRRFRLMVLHRSSGVPDLRPMSARRYT